jgi:hypothetical protein
MSIELLELAVAALDDLLPQVVFVGGATVGLWITDPGAPPARPTKDIDVVVEVTTRGDYYDFEERLRARRFANDQDDGVICRWHHHETGLVLDAMPADASILGFENRWQAAALPYARELSLPSGAVIRAVSPPYLLATKLEAFRGRGGGDFLGSRDFADIVALVDGREELAGEIARARVDLRAYLGEEITGLLAAPRLRDGIFGALMPDAGSQERADEIVMPVLRSIAEGGS